MASRHRFVPDDFTTIQDWLANGFDASALPRRSRARLVNRFGLCRRAE
jgi:hypothetical protein